MCGPFRGAEAAPMSQRDPGERAGDQRVSPLPRTNPPPTPVTMSPQQGLLHRCHLFHGEQAGPSPRLQ